MILLPACERDSAESHSAETSAAPGVAAAIYVGASECADCHQDETRAWAGSHHDLAMAAATADSVRGEFDGRQFEHHGVTSRFEQRDGSYFVTTDGPDGALKEYPVRYTFGVEPLQQYLAEMPDGKIQALPLAWDTRPAADGGQRWFHVYGDEPISFDDELHWTRPVQNWELQCADCHSTQLTTRYDVASDSYDTRWAEIDVSCEACHGPASNHLAWARAPDDSAARGFQLRFTERDEVSWLLDEETGNSTRSQPRRTAFEIDTCAPCHSRRSKLGVPPEVPGVFLDAYQPALLDPPLYHADGQVREEVYVYGSFLQSRMYQEGVTCSDCHDPHSLNLRQPGQQTCLQCHAAEKFAATTHHLHEPDSAGADCIECHMPQSTFMQVDVRHDHSFRIPRPHLARELGTPVVCTSCHENRDAAWAAEVLDAAGKSPPAEPVHWTWRLAAAQALPLESRNLLLGLAADALSPDIVRATAMARLNLSGDSLGVAVVGERLKSSNPMLRLGAARAMQSAHPAARIQHVSGLLDDPVKAVRLAALMALAPLGADVIPADRQLRYQAVIEEYIESQLAVAERAESHANIANVRRFQGRPDAAEAAYRTALRLDPAFLPAYVNLADLYRELQREPQAEAVLREGLALQPDAAALRHALGLGLVRQGRMDAAMPELRAAAESPDADPRFALAYGLALDASEGPAASRAYFEAAIQRFGEYPELLAALANGYQRSGDMDAARIIMQRLQR